MAAESLTRSSAINLINGSIDSFMFSHACYCTSNMESLSEDDLELYDQMHEVISILNDDEDYRHDLETMPLEDLKEFLLMCRKMADNNNLSLKSEFPQGNFEIVEDEKTETELNPDKIENEKSFWNTLWGALQGEYNENPTGTEILIDMGLNFIPFVGQACDVRDITACLKKLVIEKRVNEIMIWVTLLLTAIGCVPYAGDVIKAGCKAIIKGADDIVLKILRKLDADDVQKAFKILRSKFTSSIGDATAMVNKWIKEAGNSKYGSKIDDVLSSAAEKLRQASDFVTSKIDEFGEKILKKKKNPRPSWRNSEIAAENEFKDYKPQKSFKNGEEVPYGTKGSVRPDLYKNTSSIDVKNYDLSSKRGQTNLINNIVSQYKKRIDNLPTGTKQTVLIDVRGQNIDDDILEKIYNDIYTKTDGNMKILFRR